MTQSVKPAPPISSLEARSVDLEVGGQGVLRGVSVALHPGRVVAVLGPNGAGKSTLVRALSGLLAPRRGQVLLDGEPIERFERRQVARRLAVVPQRVEVPEGLTVRSVVASGRAPHQGALLLRTPEDDEHIERALDRCDLRSLAQRSAEQLSGGELRRVVVARALAQRTPLLLLDEPTAHLDLKHALSLLALVRAEADQGGLAVLIVLHDLHLAALYADDVVLLDQGSVAASGPAAEVLAAPLLERVFGVPLAAIELDGVTTFLPRKTTLRRSLLQTRPGARAHGMATYVHPPSHTSRLVAVLFLGLLLALGALGAGCHPYEALPQLVSVIDVGPRATTQGDTLEVVGSSFPIKKPGRIVLLGDLLRPGREPERGVEVEAEGSSPNGTKIEVPVTDALLARVCGRPEVAVHATFRGTLQVVFPAVTPGALPITGSMQDVVLDFRPSGQRKAQQQEQQEEADRVLAMLGLRVSSDGLPSGGLLVAEVADGSSAQQAGIARGDVLTSLDGWTLLDRSDAIPSGRQRFATVTVLRDGAVAERHVALRGYKPGAADDLVGVGALLGALAAVFLFLASPLGRVLGWLDRWAARGAAGAGRRGVVVWLASCLVAFWRGDAAHAGSDALPYVVFLLASGLCSTLPFAQQIVGIEPDVGTALLPSLTLAAVVALGAGQHPQKRRWSPLRGLVLSLWTVLYHLPTAAAVACVVAQCGSLMLHDVVRAQGGEPWSWVALRTPAGPLLLLLFFAPTLLDRAPPPTSLPDIEPAALSNLAAPPPRGGAGGALGWGAIFLLCGAGAALFLGGWALPFVDRATQARLFPLQALGALLFLCKTWLLALAVAVARETVPRLRIDQSTSPLLRWFLPLSLLSGGATALWLLFEPGPLVRRVVAVAGTALVTLLIATVARRLSLAVRTAGAQPHVSPFL